MRLLARAGFAWMRWKARHGLSGDGAAFCDDKKHAALRVGVLGETYAYWYLRRQRYVFIARNYEPRREKGELDLVGFDGDTLAFVEVRTRVVIPGRPALPECEHPVFFRGDTLRTAHAFLRERHVRECPVRFDVVAIDQAPGLPPIVRTAQECLGPEGIISRLFPPPHKTRATMDKYTWDLRLKQRPEILSEGQSCRSYARIQLQGVG